MRISRQTADSCSSRPFITDYGSRLVSQVVPGTCRVSSHVGLRGKWLLPSRGGKNEKGGQIFVSSWESKMKLRLASICSPLEWFAFWGNVAVQHWLIRSIYVTYRNGKPKASQCLKGPCTLEDSRAYKKHRLFTACFGGSHPPLITTRRKRSKQL